MKEATRAWAAKGLVGAAALLAASLCARGWPKDREIRYVLGSESPTVVELDARWTDEANGEGVRNASFRYGPGRAPRIVHHAPSLADGRYAVAITVVTSDPAGARRTADVIEHVELPRDSDGAPLSFDLAPRLAQLAQADGPQGVAGVAGVVGGSAP